MNLPRSAKLISRLVRAGDRSPLHFRHCPSPGADLLTLRPGRLSPLPLSAEAVVLCGAGQHGPCALWPAAAGLRGQPERKVWPQWAWPSWDPGAWWDSFPALPPPPVAGPPALVGTRGIVHVLPHGVDQTATTRRRLTCARYSKVGITLP